MSAWIVLHVVNADSFRDAILVNVGNIKYISQNMNLDAEIHWAGEGESMRVKESYHQVQVMIKAMEETK